MLNFLTATVPCDCSLSIRQLSCSSILRQPGPIASINADLETVVKTRPVAPGASERREVKVDVDVDPWVYMVALGYKF